MSAHTSQEPNAFASVVADDVRRLEYTVEDGLAISGSLLQTLVEGRRQAGLSIAVGQAGLEKLMDAANKMVSARADLASAHARFARDARMAGMRWQTTVGPLEPSPDDDDEITKPTGRMVQV